jgi:PPOX class probable F420-dependent enzyme
MSITTFRRDGRGVAPPVEFVAEAGSLYFMTLPDSGKVKRIRREPRVLVSPCTIRGRPTGHKLAATATLLSPEQSAALVPAFRAKYGCIWALLRRLRRHRSQGVKIALT